LSTPRTFLSRTVSLISLLIAYLIPVSAFTQVTLSPGDNVQAAVDQSGPGTTFILNAGTFRLQSVQPKDGDIFVGTGATILNGAQLLTSFGREGVLWVAYDQNQQGQ